MRIRFAHEQMNLIPLRILFLGNVIPLKGLHILLEAISRRPSAFGVDVVGSLSVDANYVKKIKQFVKVYGLVIKNLLSWNFRWRAID